MIGHRASKSCAHASTWSRYLPDGNDSISSSKSEPCTGAFNRLALGPSYDLFSGAFEMCDLILTVRSFFPDWWKVR